MRVVDVSKQYADKVVVDGISINIKRGTITSFVGPNGAGKSTLLSIISRVIQKDSGEIYIDGKEIGETKSRDLAKKLAILKQSNHLNIRLTVRELVSFGRFPYSQGRLTPVDHTHVDEAIRYLELEDLQHKYIDELSGGQRQRAFIAMVVAQDTDYILLDEPLNNLDMKHSVQIMKLLRKLVNDFGKTIIVVIHDINFASCYSDYIVAIKDGKVIEAGPADEMIQPCILKKIYDMDVQIKDIDDNKICIYFY